MQEIMLVLNADTFNICCSSSVCIVVGGRGWWLVVGVVLVVVVVNCIRLSFVLLTQWLAMPL